MTLLSEALTSNFWFLFQQELIFVIYPKWLKENNNLLKKYMVGLFNHSLDLGAQRIAAELSLPHLTALTSPWTGLNLRQLLSSW